MPWRIHSILARHGIDDEQNFLRINRFFDIGDLRIMASSIARRPAVSTITTFLFLLFASAPPVLQYLRVQIALHREYVNAYLRTQNPKLFYGGWPIHGCYQEEKDLLCFEVIREFCAEVVLLDPCSPATGMTAGLPFASVGCFIATHRSVSSSCTT